MWEELKEIVTPEVLEIMDRIEKDNNVMLSPKIMDGVIQMFNIDGVVEIEVITPEDGTMVCNVFYDPDTDEMRDMHWRRLLMDKSKDILYDSEYHIEFYYRRKKKQSFNRRFRDVG